MNVSEYQWYTPNFPEYNVAQESVIPFCDQDCNLVVCFGTAVGKSVIGECCFGYHLSNGGSVAYISPYRSLCREKYDKWKSDSFLSTKGVSIRTGDFSEEDVETSGLVVMTCESFDMKTISPLWKKWICQLKCVVFDEAHLIGEKNRGVHLETAIMRLSSLNPSCRIVLLSATMSNKIEIAKWIKSLNGKQTKCFSSNWRPNKIELKEEVVDGYKDLIEKIHEEIEGDGRKTLVFVHSKRIGLDLLKYLKKKRIRSAFHNASLNQVKRKAMESAFDNEYSGLNVLISTSTLSAGINIGG